MVDVWSCLFFNWGGSSVYHSVGVSPKKPHKRLAEAVFTILGVNCNREVVNQTKYFRFCFENYINGKRDILLWNHALNESLKGHPSTQNRPFTPEKLINVYGDNWGGPLKAAFYREKQGVPDIFKILTSDVATTHVPKNSISKLKFSIKCLQLQHFPRLERKFFTWLFGNCEKVTTLIRNSYLQKL